MKGGLGGDTLARRQMANPPFLALNTSPTCWPPLPDPLLTMSPNRWPNVRPSHGCRATACPMQGNPWHKCRRIHDSSADDAGSRSGQLTERLRGLCVGRCSVRAPCPAVAAPSSTSGAAIPSPPTSQTPRSRAGPSTTIGPTPSGPALAPGQRGQAIGVVAGSLRGETHEHPMDCPQLRHL